MNKPNWEHSKPILPSHLIKPTIETLSYNEAYYINVSQQDKEDNPTSDPFFVDERGYLRMNRFHTIELDDAEPETFLGRIGVMRSCLLDGDSLRDVLLADTRFVGSFSLDHLPLLTAEAACDPDDSYQLKFIEQNSVSFDGVIALEEDDEFDTDEIPQGVFYGSDMLTRELHTLREHGDELLHERLQMSQFQSLPQSTAQEKSTDKKEKVLGRLNFMRAVFNRPN